MISKKLCFAQWLLAAGTSFLLPYDALALEWKLSGQAFRIVISEQATPAEEHAADELRTYLKKMGGSSIDIVKDNLPGEGKQIILGRHPASKELWEELNDPDHYIIDAQAERIRLVGGYRPPVTNARGETFVNEWGLLFATYQLLEDQGVRWYRPEPEGEHVPSSEVLKVEDGRREFKPTFALRWGISHYASAYLKSATPEQQQMAKVWALRNRSNVTGLNDPKYGGALRIGGGGHVYSFVIPKKLFEKHPDFFPLIDGARVPEGQICMGNPELQEYFAQQIIKSVSENPQFWMTSIDPNDGEGWCECERCVAMDDATVMSGRGGGVSRSSRVAAFNNIIAAKVGKAHPHILLYCLAYASYMEAPTKVDHLEKNLVVGLAPFAGAFSDYSKPLLDPQSAPNRRFMDAVKGYSNFGVKMYAREYLSHYMWPGPLPLLWVMQDRFQVYRDHGFVGAYSETHPNWGPQGMILYMYLRLLWDTDQDLKASIEEYCRNFYGPAAEPMLRYHQLIEERGKGGPYFGSGGSSAQNLFSGKLLAMLRKQVEEARRLSAGKEPYAWRVESVLAGYEFASLYQRTESLINAQKPDEAAAIYDQLDELYGDRYPEGDVFHKGEARVVAKGGGYVTPSALRPLKTKLDKAGGLQKLFKNPELIALLSDGWRFRIDPEQEGAEFGWHREPLKEGEWAQVDANSPWQHQGFPDFHGTAWYRHLFPSPKVSDGRRVILAFSAVDGDATIWLNGERVGDHELLDLQGVNRWDAPFSFDITDLLSKDSDNILAVRVKKTNGNGGIYRVVRLLSVDSGR